jgi:hypothetical protein
MCHHHPTRPANGAREGKRHDHIPTEARSGSAATHAIGNGLPATVMLNPTLRAAILSTSLAI